MPLPPAPLERASRLPAAAQHMAATASLVAPLPTPHTAPHAATHTATAAAPQAAPSQPLASRTSAATGQPSGRRGRPQPSLASSLPAAPQKAALLAAAVAAPLSPAPKPPQQPHAQPVAEGYAAPSPAPTRAVAAVPSAQRKLFVLDTNVLLHEPISLFHFHEHDVFLPMVVLEELDAHKSGMTEVARHARHVSRLLDAVVRSAGPHVSQGLPLHRTGFAHARGDLLFQTQHLDVGAPLGLPISKADNLILAVVKALTALHAPRQVVLVSNDINMRIKARALGLQSEDYQNDKAHSDGDVLYSGMLCLPQPIEDLPGHRTAQDALPTGQPRHTLTGPVAAQLTVNQCVTTEGSRWAAQVHSVQGQSAVLHGLKDFSDPAQALWGVVARNREQNFAMNLLTQPDIDLVTVAGTAGSGKTLMALAAGLAQVFGERRYSEIIVTRATVSVGDDIGFLPGTEEEKMGPWMGALDDNLEFLTAGKPEALERVRSRIKIKSMSFMRGRTFMNKYVLIDEAQNLTPKQIKTLVTRAGPGTKIVCLGNLAQIDTPYLTEGSSGLTYLVEKFKAWPHAGHITLARGERSRLADFASGAL